MKNEHAYKILNAFALNVISAAKANLKTGIYFVRIKENSNKITTKKLIIN